MGKPECSGLRREKQRENYFRKVDCENRERGGWRAPIEAREANRLIYLFCFTVFSTSDERYSGIQVKKEKRPSYICSDLTESEKHHAIYLKKPDIKDFRQIPFI